MKQGIQIIAAPSILGLKPTGVENLATALLAAGLADTMAEANPVIDIPTMNDRFSYHRDKETGCLNSQVLHDFSKILMKEISRQLTRKTFTLVLGGDCSVLLGIMPAMKKAGKPGLIFIDAHADFYAPLQSTTGEVADMDLGIVTGRGPELLTNIDGLKPYVDDENVIHIGQRDEEETKRYGSRDIKATGIHCFDLKTIHANSLRKTADDVIALIDKSGDHHYWIHFDTDVVHDNENPAVDYRLPGGLWLNEVTYLLNRLIATGQMTGMSVTIYNPSLDPGKVIAKKIAEAIINVKLNGSQ